jgi:hypothetical protein
MICAQHQKSDLLPRVSAGPGVLLAKNYTQLRIECVATDFVGMLGGFPEFDKERAGF